MSHLQAYENTFWIIQKIKMIDFLIIKIRVLKILVNCFNLVTVSKNM